MDRTDPTQVNSSEPDSTLPGAPDGTPAESMTASLMARLFGVPLLIISVIIGCAVVVVLLFGSITTDRERSVNELLSIIESSGGEKTAGVLLPSEKELWRVAGELAGRLTRKDTELSELELAEVVVRLSAVLERDRSAPNLSEMGRKKLHFVMVALGRTGREEAVEPLARMLGDGDASTRREALSALSEMPSTADVRASLARMLLLIEDPDAIVRATACVALSAVADPSDGDVLEQLGRAYLDEDREVRWNAALAMARLGSGRGKSLLLDMLSRRYWEDEVRVRTETSTGVFSEYAMPPVAVSRYLAASIEAACGLDDDDIRGRIRELAEDKSVEVKNAALTALEKKRAA